MGTGGDRARSTPAPAIALAVLFAAAACKIVYDEDREKKPTTEAPETTPSRALRFDASAWVDSVWTARVLPYFDKDAVELGAVLAALERDADSAGEKFGRRPDTEGSPWSFAVRGKGKVVSVNTESRAGTMEVRVAAPPAERTVTLQIGPVVRGTAIRDTLPFLSFGDVANQIEFAQLSRALNDRAVAQVQPGVDALKAPGTPVEFSGAMNVSSSGEEIVLITPLNLRRAREN